MNEPSNILMVSIAFPPKNDPECLQSAKYFKYLKKYRSIDVVTSSIPTLFMPLDEALNHYAEGVRQLVEVDIPENKYLNFIWRKSRLKDLDRPDSKSAFIDQWKAVISSLQEAPQLIYSRSFPMSSALMAEKLADHFQVPWVMHMSDPWSVSPIHQFKASQLDYVSETERRIMEKASRISFSSQQALEAYSTLYPDLASKMLYFPNVYDPEQQIAVRNFPGDKLRFSYTGGLASGRIIDPLLSAFEELEAEKADWKESYELEFAGAFDRQNRGRIAQSTISGLKSHGLLSFSRAMKIQQESDVLVLIDTPVEDPGQALFFPSKYLDYLQSGKKILAITYKGSPVDRAMGSDRGIKCYYEDPGSVKQAVKELLERHRKGDHEYFEPKVDLPEEFSAEFQARRLNALFEELIARK